MMNIFLTPRDPVATGHIVNNKPCWPVAAYLAQMIDVCLTTQEHRNWELKDFSSLKPLYLEKNLNLDVEKNKNFKLTIQKLNGMQEENVPLKEYASAFYSSVAARAPMYLSLEELFDDHPCIVSLEEFEFWQKKSGIVYGALYQRQCQLWINENKTSLLGLVNVDNCTQFEYNSCFSIHPSLIDTLFQQLGFLAGTQKGSLMPWLVKKIRFSGVVSGPVFLETRLNSIKRNNVRGSSRVISQQGEVLLELEGIVLRTTIPSDESNKNKDFDCFRISWEKSSHPVELLEVSSDKRIIELKHFTDTSALAKNLKEMGEELVEMSKASKKNIYVLGHQSQQVYSKEQPDPIQAALWAWYLVAKKEFSRMNINLIDTDELDSTVQAINPEYNVGASRNGEFFQPAMLPVQDTISEAFPMENCLVTGGLGALGFTTANVLADLGVKHLWLVSRNASEEGVNKEALALLRLKTIVHIVACDVSEIEHALPKNVVLDLIVHSAGVVEDSLIVTDTQESLERVLYPKVTGISSIYKLSKAHSHTKVILFSSVASTNGRLGQSSYAAANAYTDAYAMRCRAEGLPWTSIQWGLWDIGVGEPIVDTIRNKEYPFLTIDQGVHALKYVLTKLPPDTYQIVALNHRKEYENK